MKLNLRLNLLLALLLSLGGAAEQAKCEDAAFVCLFDYDCNACLDDVMNFDGDLDDETGEVPPPSDDGEESPAIMTFCDQVQSALKSHGMCSSISAPSAELFCDLLLDCMDSDDDFEPSDKATITHSYVVKAISHDIANRARSVAEGAEGASASSTSCGSTLAVATFVFGLTMGAFAVQSRKAVQGYETVADETTGVKMMQMSA